jgi:hypothetical protein
MLRENVFVVGVAVHESFRDCTCKGAVVLVPTVTVQFDMDVQQCTELNFSQTGGGDGGV